MIAARAVPDREPASNPEWDLEHWQLERLPSRATVQPPSQAARFAARSVAAQTHDTGPEPRTQAFCSWDQVCKRTATVEAESAAAFLLASVMPSVDTARGYRLRLRLRSFFLLSEQIPEPFHYIERNRHEE